jgi:GNAT superfamily N-acetyltransferase
MNATEHSVEPKYRLAKESDIPNVAAVFAAAIDDLDRRHGFFEKPTPTSPLYPLYAFWLRKDPHAFWVAEDEGRVVGYTFSFLRGPLWFLADLFILPAHQGRGIGGELIRKTLGSWKGHRIGNKALITPAFNRASVSLYMRHGMLPRQPVYVSNAPRRSVARSLGNKRIGHLEVKEAEDYEASSSLLDRIHRLAMGFPSGWHNEYFFKVKKARCLIFRRNGRPVGYSFVRSDGRIGPMVVKSESSFAPAFDASLRVAVEGDGESVSMFFPGTNFEVVGLGIRHGFRIEYPGLFLSSLPMGDFGNYLFYSPGLM